MATTFLDLPADIWEKIALSLPDAGRAFTCDRFALALACKELHAFLADAPTGAAWTAVNIESGSGVEGKVAGHSRAVRTLALTVAHPAHLDPTVRLLQGVGSSLKAVKLVGDKRAERAVVLAVAENCMAVDTIILRWAGSFSDESELPGLAGRPAVASMVNRLESLTADLPSASILRNATLSRLNLEGAVPPDLPVLPSVVWLGLNMSFGIDLFVDEEHAIRAAEAFPRLATLRIELGDYPQEFFDSFLKSLTPSLKRAEVVKDTDSDDFIAPDMESLALSDVKLIIPSHSDEVYVGGVLSQTLTRLVFSTDSHDDWQIQVEDLSYWSSKSAKSLPNLHYLDLRGFWPLGDSQWTESDSSAESLPPIKRGIALPTGALPSLHTLLLGCGTDEGEDNTFNVAHLAWWDAAPALAILVVERACLVSSCDAADVAAGLAARKPRLTSVHLHKCRVAAGDEAAAGAVEALVAGRQRVCRCGEVEECLFGQDWWEEDTRVLL
jgi:hypothetical protein